MYYFSMFMLAFATLLIATQAAPAAVEKDVTIKAHPISKAQYEQILKLTKLEDDISAGRLISGFGSLSEGLTTITKPISSSWNSLLRITGLNSNDNVDIEKIAASGVPLCVIKTTNVVDAATQRQFRSDLFRQLSSANYPSVIYHEQYGHRPSRYETHHDDDEEDLQIGRRPVVNCVVVVKRKISVDNGEDPEEEEEDPRPPRPHRPRPHRPYYPDYSHYPYPPHYGYEHGYEHGYDHGYDHEPEHGVIDPQHEVIDEHHHGGIEFRPQSFGIASIPQIPGYYAEVQAPAASSSATQETVPEVQQFVPEVQPEPFPEPVPEVPVEQPVPEAVPAPESVPPPPAQEAVVPLPETVPAPVPEAVPAAPEQPAQPVPAPAPVSVPVPAPVETAVALGPLPVPDPQVSPAPVPAPVETPAPPVAPLEPAQPVAQPEPVVVVPEQQQIAQPLPPAENAAVSAEAAAATPDISTRIGYSAPAPVAVAPAVAPAVAVAPIVVPLAPRPAIVNAIPGSPALLHNGVFYLPAGPAYGRYGPPSRPSKRRRTSSKNKQRRGSSKRRNRPASNAVQGPITSQVTGTPVEAGRVAPKTEGKSEGRQGYGYGGDYEQAYQNYYLQQQIQQNPFAVNPYAPSPLAGTPFAPNPLQSLYGGGFGYGADSDEDLSGEYGYASPYGGSDEGSYENSAQYSSGEGYGSDEYR